MGTITKYGLLGFHFIFDVHPKDYISELVEKFTIRDIVKDHTTDISYDQYTILKQNREFNWLTIYLNVDGFRLLMSEHQSGTIEVWFGFYPDEDLNAQSHLLHKLLDKSAFCICGFEIEISAHDEFAIQNELADYEPYFIIKNNSISKFANVDSEEGQIVYKYVSILLSFSNNPPTWI